MANKLIDLRKETNHERMGTYFRSLQVFCCCSCGALTNRISAEFIPLRYICRHEEKNWHLLLEAKLEKLYDKSHPKSYLCELENEIQEIRSRDIMDDLVGNPDISQKGKLDRRGKFKPTGRAKRSWPKP